VIFDARENQRLTAEGAEVRRGKERGRKTPHSGTAAFNHSFRISMVMLRKHDRPDHSEASD
jgi:hypothetical protein